MTFISTVGDDLLQSPEMYVFWESVSTMPSVSMNPLGYPWIRTKSSVPFSSIARRWKHNQSYTEAKVDVTQEIEQRAQWSAPAWAACCALCSISCVTSTLASVYKIQTCVVVRRKTIRVRQVRQTQYKCKCLFGKQVIDDANSGSASINTFV